MTPILYKGKVYNAKDIYDFKNQLESDGYKTAHQIAQNYMKEFNPKHKPKNKKSFAEVVNGAKAILNVTKGEVVTQSEITRRAAICTSCPLVSETTDCVSCGFGKRLGKFITELKDKAFGAQFRIPNGMEKMYCKSCGCSLAMMIPSKMSSFLEDEEKQEERPDHCWVKKTSNNYIAS